MVFSYQDELTSTKKELLKLTTKLSIDEQEDKMMTSGSSNIKDLEQQLKMVCIYIFVVSIANATASTAMGHDCSIREANGRIAEREFVYCQCSQRVQLSA